MFNAARRSVAIQIRKYGQRARIKATVDSSTGNSNRGQTDDSVLNLCRSCGQPTARSHPHLVKEGEVVPGIQLSEFKKRREKLIDHILSHACVANLGKSHIVIIPSSSKVYMSGKIPYVFRQNTDFLYFTGCQEPDSIFVITINDERVVSTLFVRKQDVHSELWDGPRTGVEDAPSIFGIDCALSATDFKQFFASFMNENKNCVVWYDNAEVVQPTFHGKLCELLKFTSGRALVSPTSIMHKVRLIKSNSEIELMTESCKIISAAISKTISISKPKMSEHQLFATVDYECRMNGAEFLAYPPVVAAGKNANIIHYITNNQIIQDGDMVLMDAGCEYHGYTSDVSRTWPINGSFTQEQRILYEIVLDTQKTLIHKLKELPSLDELYYEMCYLLGKRLQEGGLIPKHFSKKELLGAVYTYCPHHVSHYLGMDVHDTGNIPRSIKLQPGIIVTVEPGVYITDKNQFSPPEFHGLAVRIEDDVLVTENGPINLTEACPKEMKDIEALQK